MKFYNIDHRAPWRIHLNQLFNTHSAHYFIGFLVIVNAVILGISTFQETTVSSRHWLNQLDDAIVLFFLVEISLKMLAQGKRFFQNGWHVFDLVVVLVSVVPVGEELGAIRALRVLRLLSIMEFSHLTRLVLRGLLNSLPGVLNARMILTILFYIYAVVAVYFFRNSGVPGFENLAQSSMTLFQVLTGDDWSRIFRDLQKIYPLTWVFFYSYYLITVFILLNLFIAVVVSAMQEAEEEIREEKGQKTDRLFLREELTALRQELMAVRKLLNKNMK